MPTPARVAAEMTEKQLEAAIRRIMKDLDGVGGDLTPFSFHPRGHGGFREGYPDWTIAGPRGLILRELKTETGRLTAAQRAWLKRLQDLGQDADVWRPRDLHSGRIARELADISGIVRRAC